MCLKKHVDPHNFVFFPHIVAQNHDRFRSDPSHLTLLLFLAVPQMVVKTYMDMDQDSEEEKQQYLGLALHLASEFFLRNPNKDVRLLVACCLADIFRIYAPEAPYTSHDKLKVRNSSWTAARNYL